jgi:hypothetical protein
MPMENIKQQLSDVVHHWTAIAMITLFMFSVNPAPAMALTQAPTAKQVAIKAQQEKKETLAKFSNTVYKGSDRLESRELVKLLSAVGFTGKSLKTAWAIAMRESHGRPMAYDGNRKTGDSSYGIFQINMLGDLGTVRKEKFNLRSNVLLFDPVINAEITYHMTNGGKDWSAWKGLNNEAQVWLKHFPLTGKV